MRNTLRWVVLFIIGAAVGTALDRLHVSFGVLDYPGSWPFAQRPWVPPLFGTATLVFVAGHKPFRTTGERGTALRSGAAILAFALAYLASATLHMHPTALLIGMVLGFVPFLWGGNLPRRLGYALAVAAGGFLFETTLVELHAFRYIAPGPLPVPIWLPALYLYASEAARQLDLAFFWPAPMEEQLTS